MSWDVLFQDLPNNIQSFDQIPRDFKPQNLCSRTYYEEMIRSLFPEINSDDRFWMILENENYSIEFNSGQEENLDSIMLHIRGNEKSIEVIQKICDYSGWKAIDCTAGDFIDFNIIPDHVLQDRSGDMTELLHIVKSKKWWQFWK